MRTCASVKVIILNIQMLVIVETVEGFYVHLKDKN